MNARLLIVEDEVVTRQTLTRLFQQEGYEVFDAADGLQMEISCVKSVSMLLSWMLTFQVKRSRACRVFT